MKAEGRRRWFAPAGEKSCIDAGRGITRGVSCGPHHYHQTRRMWRRRTLVSPWNYQHMLSLRLRSPSNYRHTSGPSGASPNHGSTTPCDMKLR